jgi:aryl-alcohol dehydrogenase-like predicted oxidoreductase
VDRRTLGRTDLAVSPLCLGGNTFGWTSDRDESFRVLDAFEAGGGNFVDTADVYWQYAPGNSGGESETIIGEWMRARSNRDRMVIGTKVGRLTGREGLSAANIKAAVQDSLRRLQTDYIDLYFAHLDDKSTPLEETLSAFDQLREAGTVRHIATCQYSPARLQEALAVSDGAGLERYAAIQTPYNLVRRKFYEGDLQQVCLDENVACLPFFGLAMGFLTGKYRSQEDAVGADRRKWVEEYLHPANFEILDTARKIADDHGVTVAAVALAWLAGQPGVTSVLASARTPEQLTQLLTMTTFELTADERGVLNAATPAS